MKLLVGDNLSNHNTKLPDLKVLNVIDCSCHEKKKFLRFLLSLYFLVQEVIMKWKYIIKSLRNETESSKNVMLTLYLKKIESSSSANAYKKDCKIISLFHI